MLPAAGVAKLRDVTKSTFDKHVDDDNRLGGRDIINQISSLLDIHLLIRFEVYLLR